jgi:DNA-binding NtrC family response regulator
MGAVSILVVDDDDTVRRVLRRMLETAGYEVREAPNGKAAMLEFSRQPADLLITDIFMPEQEGMETINALRRKCPGLRVIAISGVGGDHYLKMAKFLGVRATLLKPLRLGMVLEAVKTTLEQSPDDPADAA